MLTNTECRKHTDVHTNDHLLRTNSQETVPNAEYSRCKQQKYVWVSWGVREGAVDGGGSGADW